ncbi:MAG: hypothetical protein HKN09_04975, partial [Saprospiraceae bacterium]|nr:hypothetical protein [Saprospiraceae bacterium]
VDDSYKSTSISFDTRLNMSNNDYFGLGINGEFESAGSLNTSRDQVNILASYNKSISSNTKGCHYIQAGLGLGIANRSLDTLDARWPSQHDGNGGFDPNLPGGLFDNTSYSYGDISIGLNWLSTFTNGMQLKIGAAIHHVNKPSISFLSNDAQLAARSTFHGSFLFPVSSLLKLRPSFVHHTQGEHKETLYGFTSIWRFNQNTNSALDLGFWVENNNGINGPIANDYIVYGGYTYKHIKLGLAYDFENS